MQMKIESIFSQDRGFEGNCEKVARDKRKK